MKESSHFSWDFITIDSYMGIGELKNSWKDVPEFHRAVNDAYCVFVNDNTELKAHRDFVEQKSFGFGERSFGWMWWLIVKEMPATFSFMEIGVYKGAILSLIRLIADMQGKKVTRYGITPLSSSGGLGLNENEYGKSDYIEDIERIHDNFNIAKDYTLIHGFSNEARIIEQAQELKVNILYVDGAHDYNSVMEDLIHYPLILNAGGYLVCDDSCNDMNLPAGYFGGHQAVTNAVTEYFKRYGVAFEFVGNVVHNRIYQKRI